MKKDKKGGGSNADGSISEKYCSMCYENGNFLSPPDIDTAEKFQKYCIREMKNDGMSRPKYSPPITTIRFLIWFPN